MLDLADVEIKKNASFMVSQNIGVDESLDKEVYLCQKDGISYLWNLRSPGTKFVVDYVKLGVEYGHQEDDFSVMTAEDFDRINYKTCRKCKGPNNKKYSKNYWRYNRSLGSVSMVLYCYENGYCENCAKAEEKKSVNRSSVWDNAIVRENVVQLVGDDAPTQETEYADGTIYEEYPYGLPTSLERTRHNEI